MAVERIAQIDRYQGASGDTKPASPADGSIFYETDTAKTYVFAGGSWVLAEEHIVLVNADGSTQINPAKEDGNLATVATGVGAPADAAYAGGATASIIAGLKGIYAKLGAVVLAAGANIIGKVGIDQTTDGTTNKVQSRNATHDNFNANANLQVEDADVSTSNPVPASIRTRRLAVTQASYNQVLNVAAGADITIAVTPSAGELWRVKSLYIDLVAPAGAGSGSHYIAVRPYFNANGTEILRMTSNYNVALTLWRNLIQTATTPLPANAAEQMRAVQELVMTADAPLTIYYKNDSDVAQVGTIAIRLAREVEYIV